MERKTLRNLLIIIITAIVSTSVYLICSNFYYQIGYPLDDAWIYQTYARNLSQLGEWSFTPGLESGGSTGPLWVLFITVGYILQLDHHFWTYFLGTTILLGVGIIGVYGFELLQPEHKKWAIFGGLVLVLEWHLIWASVSGMETLLFAFLILLILIWLLKPQIAVKEWFFIGILIGVSVWIRPDGITLLGPAVLVIIASSKTPRKNIFKHSAILASGFLLPFGLYLIFNLITSGTIWPNTFYAKQAEYAELRDIPFILRFGQQFIAPMPGVGIILLPGFIITFFQSLREKRWSVLAGIIWFIGYLGIYAIRLPITYQHGRYIIPAMSIFFLLGIVGAISWIDEHFQDPRMIFRVISKVWLISGISILGLFWILGAKAFVEDTAIIESEMVATAHWVQENTSPDALIAAHDIGALGYFSQRDIVDLAGLISPEVIPFIRDEERLGKYLDSQEVEYLMTFPEWYPILTSHSTLIFQTQNPYSPKLGGENMAVYQWFSVSSK
ncbi:hypothetical protein ACFLXI_05435 [Chloroflexota bacterium]